jgi:hypothetical protein
MSSQLQVWIKRLEWQGKADYSLRTYYARYTTKISRTIPFGPKVVFTRSQTAIAPTKADYKKLR